MNSSLFVLWTSWYVKYTKVLCTCATTLYNSSIKLLSQLHVNNIHDSLSKCDEISWSYKI